MRAVVQRVSEARVVIDGEVVGAIGRGLLVLLCAMDGDVEADAAWILRKLVALRVFPDVEGRMNLALTEPPVGGATALSGPSGVLVVSQFTLAADLTPKRAKGNRPAFTRAMAPAPAAVMIAGFVKELRLLLAPSSGVVATGRFGADMKVGLINDGPVTLFFDSRDADIIDLVVKVPRPPPTSVALEERSARFLLRR